MECEYLTSEDYRDEDTDGYMLHRWVCSHPDYKPESDEINICPAQYSAGPCTFEEGPFAVVEEDDDAEDDTEASA